MATGVPTITWDNRGPKRLGGAGKRMGTGKIVFSTASTYAISGISRAFRYLTDVHVNMSGAFTVNFVRSATNPHGGVLQTRGFSTGALLSPASRTGYFTAVGM